MKWPAAGKAEVALSTGIINSSDVDSLTALRGAPRSWPQQGMMKQAGTLPVSVAPEDASAHGAASDTAKVQVTVAERGSAQRAGVEGLLVSVARTDAGAGAKRARVRVDYSSFRGAYGGDWASRLRLVQLPECAVTTPEKAECRVKKPLATSNDTKLGSLSTAVELGARQAGAGLRSNSGPKAVVLAATAEGSGSSGSYKASPLEASGSWSAGGSSGAFNWNYPIGIPSVPGGLQPTVSLNYSSQTVDGRTAASNNQASWIGDGWSWEPGFIERRYKPCNEDKEGGTNKTKVGDLCWYNDNATLSLGGRTTELVHDKDKGWHPANDSGEKVEKLTGAVNGDDNGEHWKVTTTDGTQFFFGLNRLPGWKDSSTPETHSAWTVPVFGNQPGEPCYKASFADAWCQQAWRWQLDYVVDTHGNAMAFHWRTESNNYGRNVPEASDNATPTPYVRGGWLDHIDYGLRSDSIYAAKAMAQVQFDVKERCLDNCGSFDDDHAKYWPDVPYDQYCKDGDKKCKDKYSPTFWTRKRLASITTKVLTGGAYRDIDSWSLEQDFPPSGDGVSTPMWLKSITRSGKVGGLQTMPPVTFSGVQRPNRVDKLGDGLAPFVRLRLHQVTTEAGGTVAVDYSEPDCTVSSLPPADGTNATRCYPVKWAYEGETAKQDWFNSYVVTRVLEGDNLASTPDKVSEYTYLDGAAWAKSADELLKATDRTYSIARGYGRVQTRVGTPGSSRTLTENRYFRGIDGKEVKNSAGDSVTDREQFAGMLREQATFNGDGGSLVTATSYTPWRSSLTASRPRSGLPDLEAYFKGIKEEQTRTATSKGERTTSISRSFDSYGMVTEVSDLGDTAKQGDEQCIITTYTRNASLWLLNKVSRTETLAVPCGATPDRPSDVISDIRTYFDGASDPAAAPTRGDVTKTDQINGKGDGYDTVGSTPSNCGASKDKLCYDVYGRMLAASDAYGKTTTTEYVPASGEVAVKTVATNPLGHQMTTELDGSRGQPVQVTDANGRVTSTAYDPLGRISKVWTAAHPQSSNPDSPSQVFEYSINKDAPSVVTTKTLNLNNAYQASYAFYDGLLRPRETQTPSPDDSGRLVAETFYDARGLQWRNSGQFYADGKAEAVLVTGEETKYPASTDTEFDGAGRATAVISRRFGDETKRTTTAYTGDTTTVLPPTGGIASTTVTDARGHTVELKQYTDNERQKSQSTVYQYDKRGRLAQVTDPAGATWKYQYDVRGRKVEVADPDKGTVITTYDKGDRVTDVKDGRGVTLHTDYDILGRRVALSQGDTKLAEWGYDTATGGKGQPASATRYVNGAAYTSRTTAYSTLYKPSMSEVTIPSAEGLLAGTYKWSTAYYHTGQVKWSRLPAAGGLPQEDLTPGYSFSAGLPTSLAAGTDALISAASYDHYGRVAREEYGDFGKHLYNSYEYDDHTGALTRAFTDRDAAPQRIDDTRYTYDPAGNVTSIAASYGQDADRSAETQCFSMDPLKRITEAWTTADKCGSGPSASVIGGADAYWTSYTYDAVGNRKTEVQHKTPSGPTGDLARTYKAPAAGKHNLTAVSQTGPNGPVEETYAYDQAGNTTVRKIGSSPEQRLDWDAEGHLATLTQADVTTGYIYDTDGARLLRKDSSGVTLYLPNGTELQLTKSGSVVGTRYYGSGSRTFAMRVGSKLTFLLSDHHGTSGAQIDASSQAVFRRKSMLFGGPRGAQPADWTGDKGFVGGTRDSDTGLTHLGAREYDPVNGRFISVDPIMDLNDPQQGNGYTYANNNPATSSDPTGLIPDDCRMGAECYGYNPSTGGCPGGCGTTENVNWGEKTYPRSRWARDESSSHEAARRAGYGRKPSGSQRATFNVGRGPDRGIIMMRFFIHTKLAMMGMLLGDDRDFSEDPDAPYRMVLFWDTATGQVSFTVAPSHIAPGNDGYMMARFGRHSTSTTIPANDIKINAKSTDTLGGNNVLQLGNSTPDELNLNVRGVQSLFPLFSVDNKVSIKAGKSSVSVTRAGDAYPDMEVIQYPRNGEPRVIATNQLVHGSGLDSMPAKIPGVSSSVDRTWVDGLCTRGC
ncbi:MULTISPECIES: RHS repeat-associated core domain-containing protein [Streptomyces]|uniref:RHS repeat domain-containing protein n=1 Tax=Streptomyces TaxID=1883 RepID=UPI0031E0666D